MKIKLISIFSFLLIFLISNSRTNASLTLGDAYKQAIARTESIPIAISQLHQAEIKIKIAQSSFRPTMTTSAIYQRQDAKINTIGESDQLTWKLTLAQSLYSGGRDQANLNSAELDKTSSNANLSTVKSNLYLLIAENFYSLLAVNKEIDNIDKSIELTKSRIIEIEKRMKIGKSRKIDLLAAQAQLSILQAQQVVASGQKKIDLANFTNSTGIDEKVDLDDSISIPTNIKDLSFYLESINTKPEILALRSALESSRFNLKAQSAGHRPSLDLTGNLYPYRYHHQINGAEWDTNLTLTFPLYAGGVVDARIQDASEKTIQVELQLQQNIRNAERNIINAYNNLMSSTEQVKTLEQAVSTNEQNYTEQEKDYRFNLATNLDVLQALNNFHDTKRSLDRTRYQAMAAWAKLKAEANQTEL